MFKSKTYKVLNCTLYGDNNKIFKNNNVFVLDKDIKILDSQLQSLIKEKKIVYLKNDETNTKNNIPKDVSLGDILKKENKKK